LGLDLPRIPSPEPGQRRVVERVRDHLPDRVDFRADHVAHLPT